ncbi:MAG: flagellar biosynthesis protein FlhB [Armatimonadota bacterium]
MADPSRTEEPTARRRERIREEGNVAKSTEPGAALGFLGALLALAVFGPDAAARLQRIAIDALSHPEIGQLTPDAAARAAAHLIGDAAIAVLPVTAAALVLGLAASISQVGLTITPAALKPDLTRLNPVKGLGRLFGRRLLIETLKATSKMAALGLVLWLCLRPEQTFLMSMAALDIGLSAGAVRRMACSAAAKAGVVLLVFAGIDYAYQRLEFEKEIRVTRYELRQDLKETEGDAFLKSRLRGLRRDLLSHGISTDMPRADVVVTNPTRIAVALWYDPARHAAPVVVAKGRNRLARRIVELAIIHRIPVRENEAVARALDRLTSVGRPIPERLYRVVAEVLAALYRARRRVAPGRPEAWPAA